MAETETEATQQNLAATLQLLLLQVIFSEIDVGIFLLNQNVTTHCQWIFLGCIFFWDDFFELDTFEAALAQRALVLCFKFKMNT